MKNSLIKNTLIYSIGEIFPKLISFILLPVFTTYLSSADYGIISYTNSVMFFLLVISSLCLNTYLLRNYFECESESERKKLIGNVVLTILFFNIFLLAVVYLLGPSIIRYTHLQIPFYPYFSLSILNNFLEVFSIVPLIIYRVQEKALLYITIDILRAFLLFMVTYLLIVHFKWGVLGNFYGRLFVNMGFMLIYITIILENSTLNFNYHRIIKSLKFSLPLIPGAIGYLLMSMSDRIILERYVSLSEIGIFSVAYTLAFSLSIIIQSGYRAFEPEIYRAYGSEAFIGFVEKIHKTFMFVVVLLACLLTTFCKEILLIMTKGDFVKGYTLIPLILIGVITTAQNALFGSVIIAEKKTKLSSLSTIIGGAISIGFNVMLIPVYGIYAAATASAVAYIAMNIIIYSGMSLKTNVIKLDIVAFILFILLSATVVHFFGAGGLSFIAILIKLLLVSVVCLLLLATYGLNLISLKFLFATFNKSKLKNRRQKRNNVPLLRVPQIILVLYLIINMLVLSAKLFILKAKNIFKRKFSANIAKNVQFGRNVQIFGLDNLQIGNNCTIGENSLLTINNRTSADKQLIIGNNVYIGRDNFLSVGCNLQVCDYVITGNKCSMICSDHIIDEPLIPYALSGNNFNKSIRIGVNCWLGHDVCILGDVTIGHGSIIGAKTVVLNNVPPFSMVVGNPGKVIKTYDFKTNTWQSGQINTESEYMDEEKYLNVLNKGGYNLPLAYHSSSSAYGDI